MGNMLLKGFWAFFPATLTSMEHTDLGAELGLSWKAAPTSTKQ